jgi:hypothetical protein
MAKIEAMHTFAFSDMMTLIQTSEIRAVPTVFKR